MSLTTSETETKAAEVPKPQGGWKETVKTLILALILALTFRTCAYEPFHIPSGSMKSNLLIGDYLFVSKFSYGYSRFSLPWYLKLLPVKGRYMEGKPVRGDVIVFHPPMLSDMSDPFIKRLVGMPGDRIRVKEAVLYINDKPIKKEYIDDWYDTDEQNTLERYRETLPEGQEVITLHETKPLKYQIAQMLKFFAADEVRNDSRDEANAHIDFVRMTTVQKSEANDLFTAVLGRNFSLDNARIDDKDSLDALATQVTKAAKLKFTGKADKWAAMLAAMHAKEDVLSQNHPFKRYATQKEFPLEGFDAENTPEYVVPAGHYFMMGDNRDNSRDSRFPDPVVYVPAENLIGRADIIVFSWGGDYFFRWGRFLNTL